MCGYALCLVLTVALFSSVARGDAISDNSREELVLNQIAEIAESACDERRADLMIEFAHNLRLRDEGLLQRPAVVDAIAGLLNDDTQAVIVAAAYLLADIGPAAKRVLPELRDALRRHQRSSDVMGFEFNSDGKPWGALEFAIGKVEQNSR